MSPARRLSFDEEPARPQVEMTTPLPPLPLPDPQATAPLADFLPPAPALPFRAPPTPLVPSLVPSLPPKASAPPHVSLGTAAAMALLAFDLLVFVYLLATWGR